MQMITLTQWLINSMNSDAYRAGTLDGWKHPKVDQKMLDQIGGMSNLQKQAKELERDNVFGKSGRVKIDWYNLGSDIKQIHYHTSIMPELCKREKILDPREEQIKQTTQVELWKKQVEDEQWILSYYDEILEHLKAGKIVKDAKDTLLFICLNAVVKQKEFVWERVFSGRVFHNTKTFKNDGYRDRICTILKKYSPYYEDGMDEEQLLAAHEIHSYAQTLEWKGPLQYIIDEKYLVDTCKDRYGVVLNSQTMEHAAIKNLFGCKKIFTIENKANYENMIYQDDTLYIFCHGFFSPKEVRFLRGILEIVPSECTFYHWGDMDYGGIRIFQFIKKNVFPKLQPYCMDPDAFQKAIDRGAGIALQSSTRKKLVCMDAGELTPLKEAILYADQTIEQELLL